MLEIFKRLRSGRAAGPTTVAAALAAELVGQAAMPEDLRAESVLAAPHQTDGDPAPGRPVVAVAPASPRDVFLVPGGLGLPAIALVNLRDPEPRIEGWTLDSSAPTDGSTFAQRRDLRWPTRLASGGWQVAQAVPLPRLQCLLVLRQEADPRTALVAVMTLADGRLRELGRAEPDPFEPDPVHVAALRASPDATIVRWHEGRVRLGRWGDVAAIGRVMLFTPLERDGLEVLRLSLDDGNIRGWGMAGSTLWLQAIDGRLHPLPRVCCWTLDLSRAL